MRIIPEFVVDFYCIVEIYPGRVSHTKSNLACISAVYEHVMNTCNDSACAACAAYGINNENFQQQQPSLELSSFLISYEYALDSLDSSDNHDKKSVDYSFLSFFPKMKKFIY